MELAPNIRTRRRPSHEFAMNMGFATDRSHDRGMSLNRMNRQQRPQTSILRHNNNNFSPSKMSLTSRGLRTPGSVRSVNFAPPSSDRFQPFRSRRRPPSASPVALRHNPVRVRTLGGRIEERGYADGDSAVFYNPSGCKMFSLKELDAV